MNDYECPCCCGPFRLCEACAETKLEDITREDNCCYKRLKGDPVQQAAADVALASEKATAALEELQSALAVLALAAQ